MKRQPNRLPSDARHGFGGTALNRGKPMTFRLNGRSYEAFEGDTVLSALLAAGVDEAGHYLGEPIALDERFAPAVRPRGARAETDAMPMSRVPVVPHLDVATVGPMQGHFGPSGIAARLASAFGGAVQSLGHRLDDPRAFEAPWRMLPPARTIEADTAVVGGGMAGMSAALAAADAGGRVVLVERRAMLGGDAAFFGAAGDEEQPETVIEDLAARIKATPSITVLLGADAERLTGTRLRVHQVDVKDGRPLGRVLEIDGKRIVLATGASERLPIFPGNRLPGVVGAVAAFHRAEKYGVWRGQNAIFSTPHSFAYRLALRAGDAGVKVLRVADSRHAPQSRYIDFCKASGLTLASSLVPRTAEQAGRRTQAIAVSFAVAVEEAGLETAALETDSLVVAGSWQPRLALWLMAGGRCAYNAKQKWLGAEGTLEQVALAGSAAGYRSTAACRASGEAAVRALVSGKPVSAVEDVDSGAIYESRDGQTTIAPWRPGRNGGFLDRGPTFTARPAPAGKQPPSLSPEQLGALSLGDVAAAVDLGAIPRAEAGIVAAERCVGGGEIGVGTWQQPPAPASDAQQIPPYLKGRFGPKPQQALISGADGRFFETGCLIYASSDQSDPRRAIGVVLGPAPGGKPGGTALIERSALTNSGGFFVRDTGGANPATLDERIKPPLKAGEAAG